VYTDRVGLIVLVAAWSTARPAWAQVVVNEVDYDQPGVDTAEFVELANVGGAGVDLDTFTLELVNGNLGGAAIYRSIDLPAFVLPAGGYYVVCANAATVANCDLDSAPDTDWIQNGAPDAVGLRDGVLLVDAVSYEGDSGAPYTETTGVGLSDNDAAIQRGIARFPNGSDTDANAIDLSRRCITPGEANESQSINCPCGNGVLDGPETCDDGAANGATECGCQAVVCQMPPAGFVCGDATDDECRDPDSCDGLGSCLSNDPAAGSACGDGSDTDCTDPDGCDGAGTCLSNDLAAGEGCGDPRDDDCTEPDDCDGAGACLAHDEVDGLGCTDDGIECTDDECAAGVCEHPFAAAGAACGSDADGACTDPDSCDGLGACEANDLPDAADCDDGAFCSGVDSCAAGACLSAGDPCDAALELCDEATDACLPVVVAEDAGPDAGPDAGADAGLDAGADAGTPGDDAGSDSDGGLAVDSGAGGPRSGRGAEGGCGCRHAGPSCGGLPLAALMVAMASRTARRRCTPARRGRSGSR